MAIQRRIAEELFDNVKGVTVPERGRLFLELAIGVTNVADYLMLFRVPLCALGKMVDVFAECPVVVEGEIESLYLVADEQGGRGMRPRLSEHVEQSITRCKVLTFSIDKNFSV